MSKQPRGIKKTRSGKYRARYFAGYDANGKRVYPQATFDRQSEAIDWLADERPNRSGSANGNRWTVGLWLDHWLASKHGLRDNTLRTYRTSIETHINPYLGSVKLRRLDDTQIDAWQVELLKKGLSKSTITSARNRLFSACEKAVKSKLMKLNPVALTDGVGVGNAKEPRHIALDEAQRLIDACQGTRFGLMFELMIRTGLRVSEALSLTWADLELGGPRGLVRVGRNVLHVTGGGWKWVEPKSKSGKRSVKFPRETAAKLTEHRRAQLEQKMKAGPLWQNNDLVFPNGVGNPIRYSEAWQALRAVLERAGLPETITTHKLRHLYIKLGYRSGVNPKVVSAEVGHSRPSFTMDYYGDTEDDSFDEACDKRDALLNRKRR